MAVPNPITSLETLYDESKGIFLNSVGINTNTGLLFRNIVTTTAWCDMSKIMTDILCGYNKEKYKALDMVGFVKLKKLIDKSKPVIEEMKKNYNIADKLKENADKLGNYLDKMNVINIANQESVLCNLSKGITHQTCQINYFWRKLLTGDFSVGIIDFRQISWLISQLIRITDSILTGDEFNEEGTLKNIMDVENNYDKIDILNDLAMRIFDKDNRVPELDEITKFNFEFPDSDQNGGYNNAFDIISDPVTNKKYNIFTKKGKSILQNYLDN